MKLKTFIFLIIQILFLKSFGQAWDYNNHRIAISADGNSAPDNEYKWPIGDPDDWGANAAILAVLAKKEMQDNLVHYSYNNFIDAPEGPDSENQNKISCDGGIIRWNFDSSNFFDVTAQKEKAILHLAKEMAKSTAEDPLYFLHAGLSEFVYQAVEKTIDIGGLKALSHVKLISHSGFNEKEKRREWHHTWADIQRISGQRIQYHKIKDQNACSEPDILWCSGKNFSPWYWMRDHKDESLRWLYTRMLAHDTGKADISDVGMLYWLLTEDENGSPEKFKLFLGDGIPNAVQGIALTKKLDENDKFTLEAIKDFPIINIPGYVAPYIDSHRKALAIDASKYQNMYAASKVELTMPRGLYYLTLKTLKEIDGESSYKLIINGELIKEVSNSDTSKDYEVQNHSFRNVRLRAINDIQIAFNSHSNGKVPEGNQFAFSRGRWTELKFHCVEKAVDRSNDSEIIVIEGEKFDLHGQWKMIKDNSASGNKYITYFGANNYKKVDNKETIISQFEISKPGTYTVKWYMRQPLEAEGDKSNDAWINFPDATQIGRGNLKGFYKFVGRSKNIFECNGQLDLHGDQPWMKVKFDKPGFYTLKISGRSKFLQIDKIILYKDITFEQAKLKTK
ncbi:hypothetical protein CLV91_2860 [Maribacter vaceletii]|uniref:Uncharacterized protein n=1 Tax=Maribacter vaceletii TaxID=1206816 RepID=A0A495DU24_9FLAO|nr:hypothetical protein [Maribacter vaceletii]RKR08090.1 hypothetical protein CLV91_2860 [Maribacter vaceletii]